MFFHQLRNELWKLFAKKRTYIGFLMFVVAQLAIILIFRYTNATNLMRRPLEGNGFAVEDFISTLTIATVMTMMMALLLLPLYGSLVGGDLVSKEAEDGSLRMILCRPISRFRLLLLKWLTGVMFSTLLVAALGVFGLAFAAMWFPLKGGLFAMVPVPGIDLFVVCDSAEGLRRFMAAHLAMVPTAVTAMSLAFMFSCFNMKPAAATILGLSVLLINRLLMDIPWFREIQSWFITYHMSGWLLFFADEVPWPRVLESWCILAGYNLTFLTVGITAFHVRDIKS